MSTTTQTKPEVPVLQVTAENLSELTQMQSRFTPFEIDMIADLNRASHYQDFRRFIYRCSKLDLDPLANEIHMEYRLGRNGQPQAQFFVHIDAYRRKAQETGQRGGFSQARGDDGHGQYVESTLWRKDCSQPYVSRVYFHEFLSPGQLLHNTMQYHMVAKCGEANVYRQAFPFAGGDIHSVEEGQLWAARDAATAETEPAKGDEYVITEKAADSPAPEPAIQPAVVKEEPKEVVKDAVKTAPDLWKEAAARLDALGVPARRAKQYGRHWFTINGIDKPSPEHHLKAILEAEQVVKEMGGPAFLAKLDEVAAQSDASPSEAPAPVAATASEPEPVVDPANRSPELNAVMARWPKLPKRTAQLYADWCVEQFKGVPQLEAFLISQGSERMPTGKLEAFLAITRHLAVSQAPVLLQYCEKTRTSLAEIEAELSKRVGTDISKAVNLPANQVGDAFLAMLREVAA